MMERIGKLVMEHGVAPENILGLTFTRNAAEEMRQRLIPVLGNQASRVTLSTIHSFCHYLLRSEGRIFEILSGRDQLVFIRGIMKDLKVKNLSIGMVMQEISLAKNNLISVEEFRTLYEGDKTMTKVADVYERYDTEKEKKYLYDFDDPWSGHIDCSMRTLPSGRSTWSVIFIYWSTSTRIRTRCSLRS